MTNQYQVCAMYTADDGKKAVKATYPITAESLKKAYADAKTEYGKGILVFPLITSVNDGEGIVTLARYAVQSFEKWERRNEYAVLAAVKRTADERENLVSVATLAIVEGLHENPRADMYTLKTKAFASVASVQKAYERNAERVYNPNWHMDNVTPHDPRATYPEMDRLIRKALTDVELTEGQSQALYMAYDGYSTRHIAEHMGINQTPALKLLYKAYRKVLERMTEIDADLQAFRSAGYTADDIATAIATFKKRTAK